MATTTLCFVSTCHDVAFRSFQRWYLLRGMCTLKHETHTNVFVYTTESPHIVFKTAAQVCLVPLIAFSRTFPWSGDRAVLLALVWKEEQRQCWHTGQRPYLRVQAWKGLFFCFRLAAALITFIQTLQSQLHKFSLWPQTKSVSDSSGDYITHNAEGKSLEATSKRLAIEQVCFEALYFQTSVKQIQFRKDVTRLSSNTTVNN